MPVDRQQVAKHGSQWRIVCNLLGSQFDHLQFRKGIRRDYHRRRDLITSPSVIVLVGLRYSSYRLSERCLLRRHIRVFGGNKSTGIAKEDPRDSLTITKNPGTPFGLGSNKIAKSDQNSRLQSLHSTASRPFETSEEQGPSSNGQRKYTF